ncbi:hypothetical protein LX36DRAFT_713701 [Colletotrichum falcatum]|nr:hypothetical protein LX36DRAFT_713701 [Colletotrichum falcatum]
MDTREIHAQISGYWGYTKQSCLDPDRDYLTVQGRDQRYYKSARAYTMKRRIVEERQALQAEFETYQNGALERLTSLYRMSLSSRAVRNLVSQYLWSAQGGFYSLSQEATDYHQTELGSTLSYQGAIAGA